MLCVEAADDADCEDEATLLDAVVAGAVVAGARDGGGGEGGITGGEGGGGGGGGGGEDGDDCDVCAHASPEYPLTQAHVPSGMHTPRPEHCVTCAGRKGVPIRL